MQANNGRPKNEQFNAFWEKLKKYLDSNNVVNDRRNGSVTYMSVAIAVKSEQDEYMREGIAF